MDNDMNLEFERIKENLEALTMMLGQGILTEDEYTEISSRMGILVRLTKDGRVKVMNKTYPSTTATAAATATAVDDGR